MDMERKMALPRVKFNFKFGYWEIDTFKWETDVYLIQMVYLIQIKH